MDVRLRLLYALLIISVLACERPEPMVSDQPSADKRPSETGASEVEKLTAEAWSHFYDGDSKRALEGLEQAAEIYAATGRLEKELDTRIKAAMVVSEVGAPERALERFEEIFERIQALDLIELEGSARMQVARSLTRIGDYAAAHDSLDRAEAIFEESQSEDGQVKVLGTRAYTLVTEGRMREAITAGRETVARSERLGFDEEAMRAKSVIAYALQQTGDDDAAYELYLELREQAWEKSNQRLLQFVYCNLAEIEWRRGKTRPAEADLRTTIEGLEAARASSPTTPEERAAFLGLQVAAYDRLIRLLADTYRGVEGFAVAERFHALSLLESLQERDRDTAAAGLPELRGKERLLLSQLGEARLALDDVSSDSARSRHRAELQSLEAQLAGLRLQLRQENPRYADLVAPEPPATEEVQAGLEPGEVLISYWISDDRLLAWAVTPDQVSFVAAPLPRQRLAATLSKYLRPLRSPQGAEDNALKGAEEEHIAAGRDLFDWLIAPITAVAEAQTLIIVPDDILHHLPFEALIEACEPSQTASGEPMLHGRYRDCRFFGTQKAIAYSPSAGVLLELRQRATLTSDTSSVLAMAPTFSGELNETAFAVRGALPRMPLTHAAEEAIRVAETFIEGTEAVGDRATEARFKAEAGEHHYLHLATHGLVDDDTPMVSGLLLEPGDGEDGLLQAHEVLGLRLQTELVTLSACRSGRGRLSRGEGIVGLARAFLYAGSSAVLVSQWDVDDRSTADLMAGFYQRLATGASRAEALRAARADLFKQLGETRIAFRQRPVAYAHPRYWSAFTLIGVP